MCVLVVIVTMCLVFWLLMDALFNDSAYTISRKIKILKEYINMQEEKHKK